MSDLLPQIIPVDEIKSAPQHVSTNDHSLRAPNVEEEIQEYDVDSSPAQDIAEEVEQVEQEIKPIEIQPDEEVFKDAKPKKKKREISDAQREHLAQARKKALEVRRRKAHEKKLIKQQEDRRTKKAEKERRNRTTPHNPLESSSEEEEVKPVKVKTVKSHAIDDIDEDLLIQLQEKAIEKYEVKRKARKEVKAKKQAEEQKEEAIYQTVKKAVQPDADDMWAVCFQ